MKARITITKRLVASALLAAAMSAGAEDYVSPLTGQKIPPEGDGKFTLEQYKARDERVLKKTGGFLMQKEQGPQTLLVDARAKPTLTMDEVARVYRLATHLGAQVAKEACGTTAPLAFARRLIEERKPLMVVAVVNGGEEMPILSVYPEERIGLVNADRLKGGDDPSAPEMRVSKETWRAIGFVGGIGFSAADNDIMQPFYTVAELDASRYPFIQPMNMAKMQGMWKRFGVKKERRIPYRVACQEGWAPAPTNEFQKAIWEQVHAIPDKPIKIEFDPKRDK